MGPSFTIGSIAGIRLRVHWTFLLLLAWFFFAPMVRGAEHAVAAGLRSVLFILSIFACVVLHEFGHAFAAGAFGIGTRDVTLLPIGGVARLERMPEKPLQELVVALAGPAVNIVIAAVLLPVALAVSGGASFAHAESIELHHAHFLTSLVVVNIFLVVFNMLPAFPMDGGRVLRAVLAMGMNRVAATRIAAAVGQAVAVGFAILGLFAGNVILMLIALFVFFGAAAEAQAVQSSETLRGARVADAMVRRFRVLRDTDTLQAAADELLAGAQQDFPVVRADADPNDAHALIGVLTRGALIRALAGNGLNARVRDAMSPPCPCVSPGDALDLAMDVARRGTPHLGGGCPMIPVAERLPDGSLRLVGLVTPENVLELTLVRSALSTQNRASPRP